MTYIYHYASPLGGITMASNGTELIGLWIDGQKHFSATLKGKIVEKSLPIFDETSKWLDLYFGGKKPGFIPPLLITGTPFQKAVAEIMLSIPYGQTVTYGEIADEIAVQMCIPQMSAQAVGGAVAHNPISIIVPCHRVVGANGNLTGYAGGIDKKIWLLKSEGIDVSNFLNSTKQYSLKILFS